MAGIERVTKAFLVGVAIGGCSLLFGAGFSAAAMRFGAWFFVPAFVVMAGTVFALVEWRDTRHRERR